MEYFNHGNYIKAVEQKNNAENISKILYPCVLTIINSLFTISM
ncbi:MAG: glycogen/starch/alpha-glucan phosphorylase [Nitrospirae bacterium]|nr:glycogen/starch/alpha-glucan phosphorylase [Nitrospirota bacterium]